MNIIEWAFSILTKFISEKSFGEVTFYVQDGNILNVKVVKTEKPPVDSVRKKA